MPTSNQASSQRSFAILVVLLGIFAFAVRLAFHNILDGDLWAKLALGASVWERGELMRQDRFAFTPVLPEYVDHEWGAGTIFYGLLRLGGPASLMVWKILVALTLIGVAVAAGRRQGCRWQTVALLALSCAWCVLPGYIPVIRSHTFTFCFFAMTLYCLEELRGGKARWPMVVLPVIMLVWVNVHAGFVAGLGTIGIYALGNWRQREVFRRLLIVTLACLAVTLINPYGPRFWGFLIKAILYPRPTIHEWAPLSLFAADEYIGFRVTFLLVVVALLAGWKGSSARSWSGLAMLALTAYLSWKSRRHAPFFGIAALVIAGPYFETMLLRLNSWWSRRQVFALNASAAVALVYGALALWVATKYLPRASPYSWAPVGYYPVREVDILSLAGAKGNLAAPFGWGSYATWRLFPNIRVSIDGRYEAVYPESTSHMSDDFFGARPGWERLIDQFHVDYIILDLRYEKQRPENLMRRGYELIWRHAGYSVLLCRPEHASDLKEMAAKLPPTTIEPLDARIAQRWLRDPTTETGGKRE